MADFFFQNDFQSKLKGKNLYILFVHSFIYTMTISLIFMYFNVFVLWKFFIILLSHMYIDYSKSHAKDKSKSLTTYLYIDQLLHISINFILFFI